MWKELTVFFFSICIKTFHNLSLNFIIFMLNIDVLLILVYHQHFSHFYTVQSTDVSWAEGIACYDG